MYLMEPYDNALEFILSYGIKKPDRTGVGCISVAGIQSRYRLDIGYFPLVTGRRLFPKAVFAELLWFLSGSTDNASLESLGCKFWSKWCDENNPSYASLRKRWGLLPGDFGPIYGFQLRHYGADYLEYRKVQRVINDLKAGRLIDWIKEDLDLFLHTGLKNGQVSLPQMELHLQENILGGGVDQLAYMVDILSNDPFGSGGRRCLFNLWNPKDIQKMALPPCHFSYQAIVDGDMGLTGILTQRSCDFPVGVPANIQFYSALTIMLAQQFGYTPREFIHETHDSHIYLSQVELVKEYLKRPKPQSPQLNIKKATDMYSYKMDDFEVIGYEPGAKMDMPVAV